MDKIAVYYYYHDIYVKDNGEWIFSHSSKDVMSVEIFNNILDLEDALQRFCDTIGLEERLERLEYDTWRTIVNLTNNRRKIVHLNCNLYQKIAND